MAELEKEATKYERAEMQRRTEESKRTDAALMESHKHHGEDSKSRQWKRNQKREKGKNESWRDQQPQKSPEEIARAERSDQNDDRKGKESKTHQDKKGGRRDQAPKGSPKLSKKEKDELRAEGRCFTCKGTGHLSKDCPQRNTLRPDLRTSSISFAHIEKLAEEARSLPVSVVQFLPMNNEELTDEVKAARTETLRSWIASRLASGGPYPGDAYADPLEDDEDRFIVKTMRNGEAFRITDKQMGHDTFDIHRSWADDPNFDVCTMLVSARHVLFEMSAINNDVINENIIQFFNNEMCDLSLNPEFRRNCDGDWVEVHKLLLWDISIDHKNQITLRNVESDECYLGSNHEEGATTSLDDGAPLPG
ncbi:hypothetical protein FRC03_007650 [Tulasnella sp. 419]|nr:hypothetical protein FRC03_007650 [Tulasnella sp. 419]